MISIIPSNKRHLTQIDWLKSYWHFSFDHYFDPNNISFGPLRVFNEDWIQPSSGFPMHPHQNMEIVTYVIDGQLEHRDNQGNHGIIQPGEVQRMTAGKGIVHSEFNPSSEKVCHLLQIWVTPDEKGLQPDWEQKQFTKDEQRGTLLPIISGRNSTLNTLKIHQNVTFYLSQLDKGDSVSLNIEKHRKVYLFVIKGEIKLNGNTLFTGDQARSENEAVLSISSTVNSELILIDLPY